MNWLTASLFSLMCFGLWGFYTKLAVAYIDAKSALIFQTGGVLLIGLITLCFIKFKPETNLHGAIYAAITGLAYGIGCLFYFVAASRGKIITVVTLTALYPLITILLSYLFLQETITLKQGLGVCFALIALILMAG